MNSRNEFGWLDGFGESKTYRCYALRCSADIIYCARQLETLLHWSCSFMGEHKINLAFPDVSGKVFVSIFDDEKKASCFLLPNRFMVPDSDGTAPDLFSTEEKLTDFYLFSKKGKHQFTCNSSGYEYLLLFTANEGFDLEEVAGALHKQKTNHLPFENLTDKIIPTQKSRRTSPASQFLKQLFIDLEVAKQDYDKHLKERFLGDVLTISDSNYPFKPLPGIDPTIDPLYLEREDV